MMAHKEPWEEWPEVWPTKAKFFAWLRGGFRQAVWSKYPGKIIFKNQQCSKPPEGYTGRAKTGTECALTSVWTGKSALEVDHIVGEASLRGWEDVEGFIRHLCTSGDNMQLVSKEAHKVKSYCERMGLSFEEGLLEKEVIKFKKLSAAAQTKLLTELLNPVIMPANAKSRVEAYRAYLKERR